MVVLRGAAVVGTCGALLTTLVSPTQAMPDPAALHAATAVSTSPATGGVTAPASNSASTDAPIPGPTVFVERFEAGGMSAWDAVSGVVAQRRTVFRGKWAARARSTGGPAFARTRLDGIHTDVAYNLRFKILRQGSNRVPVMTMRTNPRGALVDVYVTEDGKLALRNHVTGRDTQSSRRVRPGGAWHRLRVRLHIDGTKSRTKTRLDGAALPALSGGARLGRAGVARVQLGSPARGRRFVVAFDNVRVEDTGPDTTDPTAPRNLTARADSIRRVNLSWSAATDDFGVSGYTVYRDGRRIASLGRRTSYRDTDVRASTRYAYRVWARDSAGNVSAPSPRAVARTVDPVVAAAGDIACDPEDPRFDGADPQVCQQMDTSDLLLRKRINRVLTLGDNQYDIGTYREFMGSYDLSWGRVKRITSPTPGNHEYGVADAAGYFRYFGAAAGDPGEGYYSFDLGKWHLIALNSQCAALASGPGINGCAEGSPQHEWLEADLDAYPSRCTLAYWHIPPGFNPNAEKADAAVVPLWEELYAAGADVILTGHRHTYARYAPLDGSGDRVETGMRQFVVGTGGKSHGQSPSPRPDAVERQQDHTYGVLRLTLRPKGYRWAFLPEAGKSFRDVGTGTCR